MVFKKFQSLRKKIESGILPDGQARHGEVVGIPCCLRKKLLTSFNRRSCFFSPGRVLRLKMDLKILLKMFRWGGRLFYVFLIQILKGPSSGGVWRALADLEAVCSFFL